MELYHSILTDIRRIALECERDPSEIGLIAVTKGYPYDQVTSVYEAGCRDVGENRVEEALDKIVQSPQDLRWHFIGSLQTKKVNKIIGKFSLIHSVDTPQLAHKISTCSQREGVITNILLQVNTSGEKAKHGLTPEEWKRAIPEIINLPHINVLGLMTMAPFTDNEIIIRACFRKLRQLRDDLEKITGKPLPHLSMGMSNDYSIAIQEGATLLRIGTAIFKQ